mmetsp:Transcript_1046/g.1304  ORF Transcript_1046/g.1304 Transcript_1046/m.1304 type:complete len:235 (+) Transcript_1046:77-781(+)
MPLVIPPPDDLPQTATWKASAEQKGDGEDAEILYNYEIQYDDGSKTFRTVSEVNGNRSVISERNETGNNSAEKIQARKPIPDPQNLPANSTYEARRVIFTDEAKQVTTTINYTIFTTQGKYTQEEIHQPDGQLKVSKGAMMQLSDEENQRIFKTDDGSSSAPPPVTTAPSNPVQAPTSSTYSYQQPTTTPDYSSSSRNFSRGSGNAPPEEPSGPAIKARRGSKIAERYLQNITK